MRFKMAENSIFAKLLRSPWWASMGIAAGFVLVTRLVVPDKYVLYGYSFALPFMFIGLIVLWRQRGVPSSARVEAAMTSVSAMNWREFQSLIERCFKADGYTVTRLQGTADFRLVKTGRVSVVCCKRWKAANHGVEALRELDAARDAQDAHEAVYVALGEISDNARQFAATRKIRLMTGQELTQLLQLAK